MQWASALRYEIVAPVLSQLQGSFKYAAAVFQHLAPLDGTPCLTATKVHLIRNSLAKLMSELKLPSVELRELNPPSLRKFGHCGEDLMVR